MDTLDAADRDMEAQLRRDGWWASKVFQPAVQSFGPSLPPFEHPECAVMFARAQSRRSNEDVAFTLKQGRKISLNPQTNPEIWWQKQDLPAFVLHSNGGPDQGGGAYSLHGLAREAAILHVKALVIVHFFSGFRRHQDIHEIVEHLGCTLVALFFIGGSR